MKSINFIDHIKTAVAVIDKKFNINNANQSYVERHNNKISDVINCQCFIAAYNFNELCHYKKNGSCPVSKSFKTKLPERSIHHFWIEGHAVVEEVSATPLFDDEGEVEYVVEEFRDVSELLGLNKGIIAICSYCRKIRNEDDLWVSFEEYLHKHSGADFSHGVCESCLEDIDKK